MLSVNVLPGKEFLRKQKDVRPYRARYCILNLIAQLVEVPGWRRTAQNGKTILVTAKILFLNPHFELLSFESGTVLLSILFRLSPDWN